MTRHPWLLAVAVTCGRWGWRLTRLEHWLDRRFSLGLELVEVDDADLADLLEDDDE